MRDGEVEWIEVDVRKNAIHRPEGERGEIIDEADARLSRRGIARECRADGKIEAVFGEGIDCRFTSNSEFYHRVLPFQLPAIARLFPSGQVAFPGIARRFFLDIFPIPVFESFYFFML